MSSILIFLLVLSVLVFVHELGHFLAAKACNIYVDRFSIGMPPRVAGFQWGETDYCIGALPIGGFVKMAGQEDAPLTEEERAATYGTVPPDRWFNNKPVWQRFIVILAGPVMNFILAVFLYGYLAAMGAEVPESEVVARIGMVEPDSPAASAPMYRFTQGQAPDGTGTPDTTGWQTGDRILSLDGRAVQNIGDLAIGAILGGDSRAHHAILEREGPDGTPVTYLSPITPHQLEGEEYARFGVAAFDGAVVREVIADMPGVAAGLKPEDEILRAQGKPVDLATFVKTVETVPEGASLALQVRRGGDVMDLALVPATIGRFSGLAYTAQVGEDAEKGVPVVAGVTPEMAEKSGLKRKDRIVQVNGAPATVAALAEVEKTTPGGTVKLKIERPAVLFGLVQEAASLEVDVPVTSVRAVGVALKPRMIFHRLPASEVVPEAFRKCYAAIEQTVMTLTALASGRVSPKDLGGPLMIAQVTTQAADMGFFWLIKIMAFISINLGVFNLLPIPVLDGGQIVLISIEGIRRKPLSPSFRNAFNRPGSFSLSVSWSL
ncbi:MAG: PDZ domain-containing protein [Candidatus Competibacteraceae bacterium]|nr:PDZ domain-containing protein [Candidatus Competibacteraceae bacterium]